MKKLLLLLSILLTVSYAQQGKIDMHGKENSKKPKIYYGKILEIKNAMGYKYLKVNEKEKVLWVAIANAPVIVGDTIGYDKRTIMKNFTSKTLQKNFKEIIFASDVYLPQKIHKPKSMKEMLGLSSASKIKNPHQGMGRGLSPQKVEEKPKKPFESKEFYTVEEVFMWRKSLQNKIIQVKGSVYKVSHQIMKRDWVHIGDRTGKEKELTDDLVFTIKKTSLIAGDKVLAKGKVVVNKDFGYGYFYKAIVENSSFKSIK